jgi:hypothetical protein
VSGVRCQVSVQPPAKKTASQIEKETLWFCIGCFWIVGAVFNRDFPGNRGRRPLPPTINFYLNDLEFYVVSYEMSESGNASTEIYTQTLTTETQKNRDNNYEPVMTKSHHPSPPL